MVENHSVELTDEPTTLYNFQVEDFHTYYVGGFRILVHNAGDAYKRPSGCGNPCRCSLPPDILSCPDKSSHSKMYSENLSQAQQTDPSPEILSIRTEKNVP